MEDALQHWTHLTLGAEQPGQFHHFKKTIFIKMKLGQKWLSWFLVSAKDKDLPPKNLQIQTSNRSLNGQLFVYWALVPLLNTVPFFFLFCFSHTTYGV